MERLRKAAARLGKSGIAFLLALIVYAIAYYAKLTALLVIDVLCLIVLGAIVSVRAIRFITRHSLWSLRNRLLFVYGLIGVLPIALILLLVGLSAWSFMSELAIYLASSALDRRLESLHEAAQSLQKIPLANQRYAVPEFIRAMNGAFPGITFYIKDSTGEHRFPSDRPPLALRPGWQPVHGLLYRGKRFYAWSHLVNADEEITAVAPLSDDMIGNLVPNLGEITILENSESKEEGITVAGSRFVFQKTADDPEWMQTPSHRRSVKRPFPAAMSRFDVEVFPIAYLPHHDWNAPGKAHDGLLLVRSRPSAVMGTFFNRAEFFRGVALDIIIGVAVLFLLVELVALIIGVSLSRRITAAVNQMYEGTRRVIQGDFRHRIPVRARDQLGELAESFNQMTGNLERLLVIEKEKERLQTELEIAREVQNQLYPKEAPPICGLKLTVCCEPARMVSGDYYDYQDLSKGKLAFAIGDVAGKGISAALLMATLHAALRAQISHHQPTNFNDCEQAPELNAAFLVTQLNKQIYAHTAPEKYATFFFALFDESTRTLTYTNAGHLAPLLIRNSTVIPLDSNGTVVGAFPSAKYDESCLVLEPDDLLVCYTDGISEPENAYGEMFGEDRMIDIIKKNAQEDDRDIARLVIEAVREWTGTAELFDDMTLLLARQMDSA